MVGFPLEEGVNPIDLLQENHQGEFVLECQLAQRPNLVGFFPQFLGMTFGTTDQKGDLPGSLDLPALDQPGKLPRRQMLSPFIHGDPDRSLARIEKVTAVLLGTGLAALPDVQAGITAQPLGVFINSPLRIVE